MTLLSVLLVASLMRGDDGGQADSFCERELSEFNNLLRLCSAERADFWKRRYYESINRYTSEAKKIDDANNEVRRALKAEDVGAVLATDYLNKVREIKLSDDTSLIEGVGSELLNKRAAVKLSPVLMQLDAQFQKFQGQKEGQTLQPAFVAFVKLKRDASQLEANLPVKEKYVFQPKSSVFSSEPIKTIDYVMHDWNAALNQVDTLSAQVQPIEDSLSAAAFFAPKDQAAWLTIAAQLSYLLVAAAGWIKSYQGGAGKAYLVMLMLVLPSMALTTILVVHSADTKLNLLRQAILPTLFILYWVGKDQKWWSRNRL